MTLAAESDTREQPEVEDAPRRRLGGVGLAYIGLVLGLAGIGGWLVLQDPKSEPNAAGDQPRVEVTIERAAAPPVPSPPPALPRVDPPLAPPVPQPAPDPARAAPPGFDGNPKLATAPSPGLVQDTPDGPLPVVGSDGRQPWQVYARPFDLSDRRPRISILVSELGVSATATEAAIRRLPGAVSLGFVPHSERLPSWIEQARAAGHEVLLTLPMEPLTYPRDDPGRQALLTSLSDRENLQRLEWVMSRVAGYVGLVSFMGSRFSTYPAVFRPVLTAIKSRGLLYVESQPGTNSLAPGIARDIALPHAAADRWIDISDRSSIPGGNAADSSSIETATRLAIDRDLSALEAQAREKGSVLGISAPLPVVMDRIAQWAPTLAAKGLVLAPVSAVVRRP